eukprot:CAMPEP_0172788092 /NCGR_PEP_ID=MMETSP1074-20121228/206778_1 /TAXON_ID=2916 /ORGANISM="Ceratium fusus, Strain PA161109" /LENGTH=326 /DNA_ID=CAMNT_0013625113 /DNA_START=290 /DNA_END=1267 /DNA_ORIENTATION=+
MHWTKKIQAFLDADPAKTGYQASIVSETDDLETDVKHVFEMSVWHETRVALDALQDVTNAPLKFETSLDLTYVQHWESVGEKSTQTCMTKSPDKHNSTADHIFNFPDGLLEELESGTIDTSIPMFTKYSVPSTITPSSRAASGHGAPGPASIVFLLMNQKRQLEGSIVAGFQWAMKKGLLANEPVMAVVVSIQEAKFYEGDDPNEGGQLIPTARRAIAASMLTAKPTMVTPLIQYKIDGPTSYIKTPQKTSHGKLTERDAAFAACEAIGKATLLVKADDAAASEIETGDRDHMNKFEASFGGFAKLDGSPYDSNTENAKKALEISE